MPRAPSTTERQWTSAAIPRRGCNAPPFLPSPPCSAPRRRCRRSGNWRWASPTFPTACRISAWSRPACARACASAGCARCATSSTPSPPTSSRTKWPPPSAATQSSTGWRFSPTAASSRCPACSRRKATNWTSPACATSSSACARFPNGSGRGRPAPGSASPCITVSAPMSAWCSKRAWKEAGRRSPTPTWCWTAARTSIRTPAERRWRARWSSACPWRCTATSA